MSRHIITGCDGNGKEFGPIRVNQPTMNKIQTAIDNGGQIIINKHMHYTGKGNKFIRVERLARTNDTKKGAIRYVIWAGY